MEFIERFNAYIRISKVGGISRRYFVMNAFDGAMTVLGIVIAAFLAGTEDPSVIITAGVGASVAIGISGFSGSYITEESEKGIELKDMERSMLKRLDKTVIGRASKFASLWAAFVGGMSPALAAFMCLSPFFLVRASILTTQAGMYSSIVLSFLVLFLLGMYMGRLAKKNPLLHGMKILFAGFAVAIVMFFLQRTF